MGEDQAWNRDRISGAGHSCFPVLEPYIDCLELYQVNSWHRSKEPHREGGSVTPGKGENVPLTSSDLQQTPALSWMQCRPCVLAVLAQG